MVDWLAGSLAIVEVTASVLVILTAIVFLIAIELARRKARESQKGTSGTPAAKLTLQEQLKSPRSRPYCFVNGDEVRNLYVRTLNRPIPNRTEARLSTSKQVEGQAGVPLASISVSSGSNQEMGARYDPPTDEDLAEQLMARLVSDDKVAFGIESGQPDQTLLDALDEGLRKLALAGAEHLVDRKKVEEHRIKLRSGPSASQADKVKEIESVRAKYNYLAIRSDFTCGCGSEVVTADGGTGSSPISELRTDVSGVSIVVTLPSSKVKPEMGVVFRVGKRLGDTMVFGTILSFASQPAPQLTVMPLAVSLSWTDT